MVRKKEVGVGSKYLIINKNPIKCEVVEKYFTGGKKEILNVYFVLYEHGEIQPIIEKKGMGAGAAVAFSPDGKKVVNGYFVRLEEIKK